MLFYGSYEMFGNLTVAINGTDKFTNYKRSLDLETAVHTVNFTANGQDFTTYVYSDLIQMASSDN